MFLVKRACALNRERVPDSEPLQLTRYRCGVDGQGLEWCLEFGQIQDHHSDEGLEVKVVVGLVVQVLRQPFGPVGFKLCQLDVGALKVVICPAKALGCLVQVSELFGGQG